MSTSEKEKTAATKAAERQARIEERRRVVLLHRDAMRDRVRDAQEAHIEKLKELTKLVHDSHDKFVETLIEAEQWLTSRYFPEDNLHYFDWPTKPEFGAVPDFASQFDEISADYDVEPRLGES